MWWAVALSGLPSFEESLVQAEWERMNGLIEAACSQRPCATEPLEEAIARGQLFRDHLVPDPRIVYLGGLAHHRLGHLHEARAAYQRSVELDPERTDAWHDLGAIALMRGDLDDAERAFTEVDKRVEGSLAWLGPYRLAEVAGERQLPGPFEQHLKRALQRGFSFRLIEQDARWKTFYADPELGEVLRRLVTVYGSPDLLRSLER